MTRASVWNLDPETYAPHALHTDVCAWVEKNCYVDVWIELLHAHQLDPMAVMAFTVAGDFEGDQWTFFKPPQADLAELYGIHVLELNLWRPLLAHAVEHVGAGNVVLAEVDAYFLPDTAGTDYGAQHTKTTIAIETIDVEARRLGYFHSAGYHVLEGLDFTNLFGIGTPSDPGRLPLFAEIVRLDRVKRTSAPDLVASSVSLLRRHLSLRPATNPVARFRGRFTRQLEACPSDAATYHSYAFATLRQLGASFELAALYLNWLDQGSGYAGIVRAIDAFEQISTTAKALVLKGARAVVTRKPADFAPMFDGMQESWDVGMDLLASRFDIRMDAIE
jgi:hypothetical protein